MVTRLSQGIWKRGDGYGSMTMAIGEKRNDYSLTKCLTRPLLNTLEANNYKWYKVVPSNLMTL